MADIDLVISAAEGEMLQSLRAYNKAMFDKLLQEYLNNPLQKDNQRLTQNEKEHHTGLV